MKIAAIPLLVRQHAQDGAFLFDLRAGQVSGPAFDETDLGRRDQRLAANLEGLAAAGDIGWSIAREEAATWRGAGQWFALLALAIESGAAARVAEAAEAGLAAGAPGRRGLSGAVAWSDPSRLRDHVRGWLASADPGLRWLGTAVLSHHRVDPGPRLGALLDDPDGPVRDRAARLAGELGRRDALPRLREEVEAGGPLWVAWSAARLGAPEAGAALLSRIEARPGAAEAPLALDLALLALKGEARAGLTRLLGRPQTRLLGVSRMGVLGDPSVLPWLVGRMREPLEAEAAGFAFRDMFAVDIDGTDLFTSAPETLGGGFAGLDPAPIPIADRVEAWAGPDPSAPPFRSQRALMLRVLREGIEAPDRPLCTWRHRRRFAAWI